MTIVTSAPALSGDTEEELRRFRVRLYTFAGAAAGVAVVAIVFYVLQFRLAIALSVLGSGIAVGAAATTVGVLVGFLFGVPRTVPAEGQAGGGTQYAANTSLEQISDWLTKVLVGVGLVQITAAPDALGRLSTRLGPLFGNVSTGPAFGLTLAIYLVVSGFVVAYVWTRTFFHGVLMTADRDVATQIGQALDERQDVNARALALTERQLAGKSPPAVSELETAVAAATSEWSVQIFARAETQRRHSWRSDPESMERTIPVFRALTTADTEQTYFRHFASLGFTLKDQAAPAFADAAAVLTTAIEIRDRRGAGGLGIYEWNRAVCRIQLDTRFAARKPSTPAETKLILSDLHAAAADLPDRMFAAGTDPGPGTVSAWMRTNGQTYRSLRSAR